MRAGHCRVGGIGGGRQDAPPVPLSTMSERIVSAPPVGVHHSSGRYHVADEGHQAISRRVRDVAHANTPEAPGFLDLNSGHDDGLLDAAASFATVHLPANQALVDLDSSGEGLPFFGPYHGDSEAMQHAHATR